VHFGTIANQDAPQRCAIGAERFQNVVDRIHLMTATTSTVSASLRVVVPRAENTCDMANTLNS